jgi:hypothetical protein
LKSTSNCGSTAGCYAFPIGCKDTGCTFVVKWVNSGTKTNFELYGKVEPGIEVNAAWIAMGFSDDRIMVNKFLNNNKLIF